eukprot:403359358
MDFCFPNPATPVIVPNSESLKHRKRLRFIMYGQIFVAIAKMILFGVIQGIFQLFSVWIIYSSWASMHFCSLIFFMFSCGIDLLMMFSYYSQINMYYSNSPIKLMLYYTMVVYMILAMIGSFQAYRCFKSQYDEQYGNRQQGYVPFRGGMSQYDDENQNRRGGQTQSAQRQTYLVSGPNANSRNEPQNEPAHRNQSNYRAFQGQGVRLGG